MPASTPDSEAPASPIAAGDLLAGKYRVEKVLGSGGMGIVVSATHTTLNQRVALKFLLPAAASNAETTERFLREAKAAARLKSEHVAKVIDVGTLEDGAPYMVMEYLDGATLGQLLRRDGPPPVQDAVGYVMQACEAVAEAHAAGIVHRDLKPENLFLTRRVDGQPLVKVLDFGIAKNLAADAPLSLTRTSTIVGSPLYMAPEQLRSARAADMRSDIWSLGAVLFELLTGRVPFTADSFSELCMKVAQDAVPTPSTLRAEVPAGLDAAVLRCLEKDPTRRYQNVGEMAEALVPFAPESERDFARRVASVLAGGTWPPAAPGLAASGDGGAKAQTGTAWGNTSSEANKRRRLTWSVGVAVLAAAAGAVVLITRPWAAPPAAAQSPAGAAQSAPATATATATTVETLAGIPVAPSASAPGDSASGSASAAIAAAPAPSPPAFAPRTPPHAASATAAASGTAHAATPSAPSATATGSDIVHQRK